MNRLVSFIIVNWNGRHLLSDCLGSIMSQTYKSFEVIVVDNGSSDDSVSYIGTFFPTVKVVALSHNTGFTGGNIEGLSQATGDFIALINNDVILSPRWLENMVVEIEADARIGLCSSKIIKHGTETIDSIGEVFTQSFVSLKLGEHAHMSEFQNKMFVPGACAAAVIYRKTMIDSIGFLDEDFFLNYEDSDLNMRAWLTGWKCLYVPTAVAFHKVSATLGSLSPTAVYYLARNSEWVWLKNAPGYFIFIYFFHKLFSECISFIYLCILRHQWRPFFKGKFHAFMKLKSMLRKRTKIQKMVAISNHQIKRELLPLTQYVTIRFQALILRQKNIVYKIK